MLLMQYMFKIHGWFFIDACECFMAFPTTRDWVKTFYLTHSEAMLMILSPTFVKSLNKSNEAFLHQNWKWRAKTCSRSPTLRRRGQYFSRFNSPTTRSFKLCFYSAIQIQTASFVGVHFVFRLCPLRIRIVMMMTAIYLKQLNFVEFFSLVDFFLPCGWNFFV